MKDLVLKNHFRLGSDYLDEELEAFAGAMRIKKSHIQAKDDSYPVNIRPKGECRKVRYRSRKDALQALRTIKYLRARYEEEGHSHLKVERRAYRCCECAGGYHLTSKPWSAPRISAQVINLFPPILEEAQSEVAHVA